MDAKGGREDGMIERAGLTYIHRSRGAMTSVSLLYSGGNLSDALVTSVGGNAKEFYL